MLKSVFNCAPLAHPAGRLAALPNWAGLAVLLVTLVAVATPAAAQSPAAESRPPGVGAPAVERPAADEAARRAVHLLDYLAVDYPETVSDDGAIVNQLEYAEQIEFSGQVRERLAGLGVAADDPLAAAAAALEAAIVAREPGARVSARARSLAADLRDRFGIRALPAAPPDPERGAALYAQACASCHGAEGRGDGPAGVGLDPPPSDLTDPARLGALSPFALYSTITYGIAGTAMAPFGASFDDAARWDLAFYAATLHASPQARARGAELAEAEPARVARLVPSLQALVETAPAELAAGDAEGGALVAHLLAHPDALRGRELPLAIALARLDESLAAWRAGRDRAAVDLAVSAYLDGFEHVEPALSAVDARLRTDIEAAFLRYREALRAGRPPAEIEALHAALVADLARAERRLTGGGLGPGATFAASLTILVREGLEAVLLVMAIVGVLGRTGRRDALPWVHAGWIGALAAGAATWWAAGRLVEISGARREVVEGVSALLAAAILFYVSYWLVSKLEAARWQAFVGARIREAASGGRLLALAGVTFVAVYRECFETVLFYQALAAQAGPGGGRPLAGGIAAGVVLLAAIALAFFRFGRRLALRRFFALSSGVLYALAVVMAGHGIAALQEAGWLPTTLVPGPTVEWLGLHPTVEGLAVQGGLLLAALVAFVKLSAEQRRASPEAAPGEG
ncbi:MAG TPA: cytochrome c/FTR1 family iron permease [Myxococcota bacterium]